MADIETLDDGSTRVNIGYEAVHICKLYGPTIFADLTIKPAIENDEFFWIVYREDKEWCRIPAQLDEDFADEE